MDKTSFECGVVDGGLHEESWPDSHKNLGVNVAALLHLWHLSWQIQHKERDELAWQIGTEGKKKGKPVCVFLTPIRLHSMNRCPSPSCQSPLYRKQIALSVAGMQLPLTSTATAQIQQWETFSPLDQNSSYAVQSQKRILAVTPHTLPRGLQVWEEFSPRLIRRSWILFLLPLDFTVLTASINLS